MKIRSVFSRDMSQIVEKFGKIARLQDMDLANVEKSFKKSLDPDPEADELQI